MFVPLFKSLVNIAREDDIIDFLAESDLVAQKKLESHFGTFDASLKPMNESTELPTTT